MINLENGNITDDNGTYTLDASAGKEAFLAANKDLAFEERRGGTGHFNYTVRDLIINGKTCIVTAYFDPADELTLTHLCIPLPDETRSWDDWTLQKMLERKAGHDLWLKEHYNINEANSFFPWGSIYSVYDDRAGSSYISIKYNVESQKHESVISPPEDIISPTKEKRGLLAWLKRRH